MIPAAEARTVGDVKRWLLLTVIAFGLLFLALAAWAVQGVRLTLTGSSRRRTRLATADAAPRPA